MLQCVLRQLTPSILGHSVCSSPRACIPPFPLLPPAAAALPALTSITLHTVPTLSDETLHMVGQRHLAVASLAVHSCGALTGLGLGAQGAYPALRSLAVEFCDAVTG